METTEKKLPFLCFDFVLLPLLQPLHQNHLLLHLHPHPATKKNLKKIVRPMLSLVIVTIVQARS